jgi:hypothetical protein
LTRVEIQFRKTPKASILSSYEKKGGLLGDVQTGYSIQVHLRLKIKTNESRDGANASGLVRFALENTQTTGHQQRSKPLAQLLSISHEARQSAPQLSLQASGLTLTDSKAGREGTHQALSSNSTSGNQ